jgi:Protein of unknown function (DUF1822)
MVINMKLSIADLRNIAPESIWIEITATDRLKVEREVNNCHHSNQIAKYHARLNRLSLYALQAWLQAEETELASQMQLFPSAEGLPWVWEIVNGTAFDLGTTRLVIIPSDLTDTEELNIPQEWLDVPNWVGNYYLAVRVDEANNRICIWGYIGEDEVKTFGRYDEVYRNYRIDREYLHTDLDLLWMDCQLHPTVPPKSPDIPLVGSATVDRLIAQIATPAMFSPRLDLKFTDLVAILNSVEYLQKLYVKRNQLESLPEKLVRLSDWFNGIFDRVWQPSELVFSYKNIESVKSIGTNTIQPQSESVGAKIINLAPVKRPLALIIHQSKISAEKTEILVRICPANESIYLPDNLRVNILDEEEKVIPSLTKKAQANNWLQLKFTGDAGDRFSTSIEFGEDRAVDRFII